MKTQKTIPRHDYLTFKANLKETRYGWLRLTPAYSAHLVAELLDAYRGDELVVLDPFCGTGTTALVCAERGIACDTTDINPFLLWLTKTKTQSYDSTVLAIFREVSADVLENTGNLDTGPVWTPALHQIEKWWDSNTLNMLGRVLQRINDMANHLPEQVLDLLKLTFCQTMIGRANVSFSHQSMSFRQQSGGPMLSLLYSEEESVRESWSYSASRMLASAGSPIIKTPRIAYCDARHLSAELEANHYTCVITSPPYPNRVSYIRELRPYMYWLGYLQDGRAAGALDWSAIGGTWGSATSNLSKWQPQADVEIPFLGFQIILDAISEHSLILSRYVHKYFYDMILHCRELFHATKPGGLINYIVGNSKFYDVMLPVEEIYADIFRASGFCDVTIKTLRKRTSKRELYEFLVSARRP